MIGRAVRKRDGKEEGHRAGGKEEGRHDDTACRDTLRHHYTTRHTTQDTPHTEPGGVAKSRRAESRRERRAGERTSETVGALNTIPIPM